MLTLKVLLFYYFVIIRNSCRGQFTPNSPCPGIFQYDSQFNSITGLIQLSNVQTNNINLQVQMTVGRMLGSQNTGSLQLVGSPEQAANQITNGQPVYYRINFPTNNPVPNINEIYFNGNLICSGQSSGFGFGQSTITLNSQLRTNARPPLYSNNNNNNNFDTWMTTNQLQNNNFNQQLFEFQRPTTTTVAPIYQYIAPPTRTTTRRPRPPVAPGRPAIVSTTNSPISPYIGVTNQNNNIVCGKPSTNIPKNRVLHGQATQRGEYPWLVGIYTVSSSGHQFSCGGTIISDTIILTAAHCLKHPRSQRIIQSKDLAIALGRYNTNDLTELSNGAKYVNVNDVIINPGYKRDTASYDADIGLLTTEEEITYTDYIRPICLWNEDDNIQNIVGKKATIVGWGRTEEGSLSPTPRFTQVPIVSQEDCLRQSPVFSTLTSNKTFCAGGQGSGPCQGDSGSGLIMNMNDQWYLRGIVSNALTSADTSECDVDKYTVYTDITKFRGWLEGYLINN
uniref:Putative trypsin-like serine protease n=1 Tax=Corethrella appendiculata TaxID=1370023 RepID=U5EYJ0_9DIPT